MHLIGQEILHVPAFLDGLADETGGYLYLRGVEKQNVGMAGVGARVEAVAPVNIEFVVIQQHLVVLPLVKGGENIGAGDQYEPVIGVLFLQADDRIDGVGRLGHLELDVAGPEARVVFHRELYHHVAVMVGQQAFLVFQRVVRRNNEPDIVQIGKGVHITGNDQVPGVDRVK